MNKIKRYDCYSTNEYGEATIDWDENETGEYIKSEDFDKYDKKQEARIDKLEDDLDMCQRYLFENGCDDFFACKRDYIKEKMGDSYQEKGEKDGE